MIPMLLYLLLVPWCVMRLAERWKWIDKVSPMTVLYIIGLTVGNIGIVGQSGRAVCSSVSNVTVLVAIPLMLMGCNLKKPSTGKALKIFLSGLAAVLIVTVSGFFIFQSDDGHLSYENYAQVCAVATGIYTGGIANVSAIAQGTHLPNELYILITGYDLIATGLYLLFVIFFGKTVFRKLLPKTDNKISEELVVPNILDDASNKQKSRNETVAIKKVRPFDQSHWRGSLLLIGITTVIAALSYGVSLWVSGGKSSNMTVLILLLTTMAIGASFLKPVQRQEQSFNMGLYCVYVFCLAIATMVDIHSLNLAANLNILYYILFVIFGSLVLQILFAKMLRIDGDSVLVCSIALINSPPFVPLVAALLNNKDIVVLGISIGLLGYMLGNYLGIGIYHFLMLLGG